LMEEVELLMAQGLKSDIFPREEQQIQFVIHSVICLREKHRKTLRFSLSRSGRRN